MQQGPITVWAGDRPAAELCRVLCVDVGDAGFPCYMAPPVQRLLHNAAALAADGTKQKDDET